MNNPEASQSAVIPRFEWIDAAKGLAILAIIYYHFCGFIGVSYGYNTQTGVDAFLILSGFGLTISRTADGFGQFIARRLFKLLPAYWIILASIVTINWFAFHVPVPWKNVAIHLTCFTPPLDSRWGSLALKELRR